VFGAHLEAADCTANVAASHMRPDYFEPCSALTDKMTMADRFADVGHKLFGNMRIRETDLCSRLDIQKAIGGYKKPPHCDRPNRLCSLIVDFTDAVAEGIEGGNLRVDKHHDDKPVQKYERHPAESNVDIVAELTSAENLSA